MEILDICDELGNPTGKTVEREIAHQQGMSATLRRIGC